MRKLHHFNFARTITLFITTILLCSAFVIKKKHEYKFVALGDGYTHGTGVTEEERWTNLITARFEKKEIKFKLKGNLSDSIYSINDVIKNHMVEIQGIQPNLMTIMLGMAEVLADMSEEKFKADYEKLLTLMLAQVPTHNSILLITIPDFTAVPYGRNLTKGFDARAKIIRFNRLIKEIGHERHIRVLDLFQQSDQLGKIDRLLSRNGIFPSKYGHEVWADIIYNELDYLMNIPLNDHLSKKERKKLEK